MAPIMAAIYGLGEPRERAPNGAYIPTSSRAASGPFAATGHPSRAASAPSRDSSFVPPRRTFYTDNDWPNSGVTKLAAMLNEGVRPPFHACEGLPTEAGVALYERIKHWGATGSKDELPELLSELTTTGYRNLDRVLLAYPDYHQRSQSVAKWADSIMNNQLSSSLRIPGPQDILNALYSELGPHGYALGEMTMPHACKIYASQHGSTFDPGTIMAEASEEGDDATSIRERTSAYGTRVGSGDKDEANMPNQMDSASEMAKPRLGRVSGELEADTTAVGGCGALAATSSAYLSKAEKSRFTEALTAEPSTTSNSVGGESWAPWKVALGVTALALTAHTLYRSLRDE